MPRRQCRAWRWRASPTRYRVCPTPTSTAWPLPAAQLTQQAGGGDYYEEETGYEGEGGDYYAAEEGGDGGYAEESYDAGGGTGGALVLEKLS